MTNTKTDDEILIEIYDDKIWLEYNSHDNRHRETTWDIMLRKAITLTRQAEQKRILELIDEILLERRKQVNKAFEGKDERTMTHLHTFINKFEEEFKQKIQKEKK